MYSPRSVIMDSAVTAQLAFGGHSDPMTVSTEFKTYSWKVTGSPKSNRAGGWQLMKTLLYQAGKKSLVGLFQSDARDYGRRCLIAFLTIAAPRIQKDRT